MEVSLGAFECSYLGAAKAGQSNDARAMAGILSSLQAGEKQKTTLEVYSGSIVFLPASCYGTDSAYVVRLW